MKSLSPMFKHAIVKTPCRNIINGISAANLGAADYPLALQQHQNYIAALEQCGLKVSVLPADEAYPDSCFVEDPALVTTAGPIITQPGAASRKGETAAIEQALMTFFPTLQHITDPGTLDGGDVMMVDNHFYIGLSARTNADGAQQLIQILQQHGMTGSVVRMSDMLHLKTGLSYLENNTLVAAGEFIENDEFTSFEVIPITADEAYAANCVWVNGKVIVPIGFPRSQRLIEGAGYEVLPVDVSEFQKLDGGLSCLSLRF